MSDHLSQLPDDSKKLLEKPLMGGIAVPIAIVLVGVLIIFGVTKMLSNDRSYKDLVSELHSKTFGNRWVAAYELSKLMSSNQIPKEDIPWLVENLSSIYKKSVDARTRNFIILALGSLKHKAVVPTIAMAINDKDDKVKFNAVVSIGNQNKGIDVDWKQIAALLKGSDPGLRQVAAYAIAQHGKSEFEKDIVQLLSDAERSVKYSAAVALINFKNESASKTLVEVLSLVEKKDKQFNEAQVEAMKLNAINAIGKNKWKLMASELGKVAAQDKNQKVAMKAREVLNLLKN